MFSSLVKFQRTAFQQLHQMRTRNIQQVGFLLRRQLRMHWYDFDRIAICQLGQYVQQQPQRRRRQPDGMRLVIRINNLDPLRFKSGGKICRKLTLAFNGHANLVGIRQINI